MSLESYVGLLVREGLKMLELVVCVAKTGSFVGGKQEGGQWAGL
jgi:hypothetical protein